MSLLNVVDYLYKQVNWNLPFSGSLQGKYCSHLADGTVRLREVKQQLTVTVRIDLHP